MKTVELNQLKEDVINAVKAMPYGEYATTNRIAHSIAPDAEFDFDDLFELENAIYLLDESNEVVIDKLAHFNKVEGLAYNLDFVKLENKGIPNNCYGKVEFNLSEGNRRRMIEGIIDFRTGRVVIYEAGLINNTIIKEISEEDRKYLVNLFPKDIFIEEETEMSCEETAFCDGIEWSVSVDSKDEGYRSIYGKAGAVDDIPMASARELFKLISKLLK